MLNSEEILDASIKFLNIRVFTLFFSLGCVIMRSFFVGIQLTKYIGLGAFIVAGTNFVFDYVLIFGKFGFPRMGLEGAALASVLAEIAGLTYYVWIVIRKVDLAKYNMFKFRKPELQIVSNTMKLSVFTMLQNFLSVSGWFLFFVIMEKTGEKNLAASNIIRSYYILALAPVWAYSATVSTLVSNAIGANKHHHVFQIIKRVALFGLVTSIVALIPALVSAKGIMSLYTSDTDLIEIGFRALYVIGLANVLTAVAWVIFSAISATGNTMIALFVESSATVFYVASAIILAANFPAQIEVIWSSELVYYSLLGIISVIYLKTGHWKKKVF